MSANLYPTALSSCPVFPAISRRLCGALLHSTTAWVVLFVSILLTGAVWDIFENAAIQKARGQFSIRAEDIANRITQRMEAQENLLRGGVGLFSTQDWINRQQWQRYVENLALDKTNQGIQGFGVSLVLKPNEVDAHIESVRREGYTDYAIHPAGARDIHSSIVYLEPFAGANLRAFGYDMYSEPIRRTAMERARDSGAAAVSDVVRLLQGTDADDGQGFMMYLPVYRAEQSTNTVEERRAAILGYVFSTFRIKGWMEGILGVGDPQIDLRIYDDTDAHADQLLFDSARSRSPVSAHDMPQIKWKMANVLGRLAGAQGRQPFLG